MGNQNWIMKTKICVVKSNLNYLTAIEVLICIVVTYTPLSYNINPKYEKKQCLTTNNISRYMYMYRPIVNTGSSGVLPFVHCKNKIRKKVMLGIKSDAQLKMTAFKEIVYTISKQVLVLRPLNSKL